MAVFLVSQLHVLALDPGKSVLQYNSRTWTYQNGLPVNGINAITQTRDGYIWLGTSRGLVRFDGDAFVTVGMASIPQLRSTIVQCLSPSVQGGLWFGLYRSGYGYFDGRDGWTVKAGPAGRKDWDVRSVRETGSTLWIGGIAASSRPITDDTLTTLFSDDLTAPDVSVVFPDSKGRVWLGTSTHGLYYWETNKLTKLDHAFDDERFILSMAEDKLGRIWVGTHIGLCWFDSDLKRHDAEFPALGISALLVDSKGVLWIGTTQEGLARWRDGGFDSFRKSDGLAGDSVLSLAEDREGSLWVGTKDGLSQLADVKLPIYSASEGVTGQSVQAVSASPREGLWIATDQGVIHYSSKGPVLYSTEAGLKGKYVKRAFEASNGDVFLLSGRNDIEVMVDGKVVACHPTPAMPVALTEDEQGVVVSVAGDLYRVGRDYLTPYEFVDGQKPPLYWVLNLMTSRDGAIWVASVNGVCRVKDGKYQQWTQQEGLLDYNCRWLMEDEEGVIWAGMAAGISRIKKGQIRNVQQRDGLLDGDIHEIVADDRGDFWVDSGQGIFRVSKKSLNDFADGLTNRVRCVAFNGPEAIKPTDKYQQEETACKTADGRIWFPTSKGVVMIDPEKISVNRVPPPVNIQGIRVNGHDLEPTNNIILQPGAGDLEIHYAGLSYIAPLKIQYRYKLAGRDKDWVDAGNRRVAFYSDLTPGEYTFHIQACNADGVWSVAGANVAVTLLPYYYQTAWFKGSISMLAVLALLGIYGWRLGHLRRREQKLQEARELLEEKVKERTAELAASNEALKNEVEERTRMQMEVERIHRQLVDASRQAGKAEVASSVLHNVGNVLNSVNISTSIVADRIRALRTDNLAKAAELLEQHHALMNGSLDPNSRIRQLPGYLNQLANHLDKEQQSLLQELRELGQNVDHIKEIVAMQQSYARVSGVQEKAELPELVESALKMHSGAFSRHGVVVKRFYEDVSPVSVDKHKVMQILINLLHNAKYACDEGGKEEHVVTVRIKLKDEDFAAIEVEDNGIGIAPENMAQIFRHGFTTKENGHGFGLHSAALAARELGGSLAAQSDGLGKGATFVLELPLRPETPEDSKGLPASSPMVAF